MLIIRRKYCNKSGFTLIELIVVIAIVAVLAIVGIPTIAGQVIKAKQATADANAKIIATQVGIMLATAETKDNYSNIMGADGEEITIVPTGTVDGILGVSVNDKTSKLGIHTPKLAGVDVSKVKNNDDFVILLKPVYDDPTNSTPAQIGWTVLSVTLKIENITGTWGSTP